MNPMCATPVMRGRLTSWLDARQRQAVNAIAHFMLGSPLLPHRAAVVESSSGSQQAYNRNLHPSCGLSEQGIVAWPLAAGVKGLEEANPCYPSGLRGLLRFLKEGG
jgi:hypothetical protein